jgi:hypothetical protein
MGSFCRVDKFMAKAKNVANTNFATGQVAWESMHEAARHDPPFAPRRRPVGRGARNLGGAARHPSGARPACVDSASFSERTRQDGGARRPWRHDHRRRGRHRPQRLRPALDPHRLGHRHGAPGSRWPHGAALHHHRRGQGDRDRAGPVLPGLDLQRSRPGSHDPRHRGRARAGPIQESRLPPALDPLPRHPRGAHGRRAGGRRGAAGRRVRLRVRRLPVRLPSLSLPTAPSSSTRTRRAIPTRWTRRAAGCSARPRTGAGRSWSW